MYQYFEYPRPIPPPPRDNLSYADLWSMKINGDSPCMWRTPLSTCHRYELRNALALAPTPPLPLPPPTNAGGKFLATWSSTVSPRPSTERRCSPNSSRAIACTGSFSLGTTSAGRGWNVAWGTREYVSVGVGASWHGALCTQSVQNSAIFGVVCIISAIYQFFSGASDTMGTAALTLKIH